MYDKCIAVHCPSIPSKRSLIVGSQNTKLNSRVKFSCAGGNNLVGNSEIVCLPSGNWSDPIPSCESKYTVRAHARSNGFRCICLGKFPFDVFTRFFYRPPSVRQLFATTAFDSINVQHAVKRRGTAAVDWFLSLFVFPQSSNVKRSTT